MACIGNGEVPTIEEFSKVIEQIRAEADYSAFENPAFENCSESERIYLAIREQAYRIARHYKRTPEGGRIDE